MTTQCAVCAGSGLVVFGLDPQRPSSVVPRPARLDERGEWAECPACDGTGIEPHSDD